jgi:RND family efflux transporter MFP subunit
MLKRTLLIITAMGLLISFGCNSRKEDTDEKEITGKGAVYIETAKVIKKDIYSYIEYAGQLEAVKIVDVVPNISAVVETILVKEGDFVKEDELLAVMDSTQLKQAKLQFENLKKTYERMEELKNKGSLEQSKFDEVETGYKIAKTGFEFLQKHTNVRAPISGIISYISVKENETFSPAAPTALGKPCLFRLINLHKMKANINISDKDITSIKVGQKVIVETDSNPEEEFFGKISFVSPQADRMAGTFLCEIEVNNNEHLLKHFQFARIKILTDVSANTLVIPQNALVNSEIVFVIENDIAQERTVATGIQNEYEIEILSGISENEIVAIKGNIGMKDNLPVQSIK